ncbi:MAG: HlyD family efflux transporter periplasmic adaptor subunit [Oscillospiraceae bacterium]
MDINTRENTPKRKKKFKISYIFMAFLLCYFFLQIYLVKSNNVETVKAVDGYINDGIIAQGIICRDEIVLSQNINGVIDYLVPEGQRIAKGTLIGKTYPNYSDVETLGRIRTLEQLHSGLDSTAVYLESGTVDVSLTRKQLNNQLSGLSYLSCIGDYSNASKYLTDLMVDLNKINVATGKTTDFSSAQSALSASVSQLSSSMSAATGELYSPNTGYFLKYSDGYEDVATTEKFLTMSYEEGSKLINTPLEHTVSGNEYGKIITDYKWSICTYIDSDKAERLKKDMAVRVSLSATSNDFQKATVKEIVNLGEKTLVIIECTIMDDLAATTRITDCEILFKQYSGIKIPKSAIHIVDGDLGVYVKFSQLVRFKKITRVFEDDNYVIVSSKDEGDSKIKLYDEVIVKGRDLYDGKYL